MANLDESVSRHGLPGKCSEFPSTMLVQYVRDEKNRPYGVVVAIDNAMLGWASCRLDKGDRFCKAFGKRIAYGRAIKGSKVPLPLTLAYTYGRMVERARKYYK